MSLFDRDNPPPKDGDVLPLARWWLRYFDEVGSPSGFKVTTNIVPLVQRMVHEIERMHSLAGEALDLVDEYSGGESETANRLRFTLDRIVDPGWEGEA